MKKVVPIFFCFLFSLVLSPVKMKKQIKIKVGENIAMLVVESFYKEPEREGKPYYNRMNVSYGLKKLNGKW